MRDLIGEPLNGTWTLSVRDEALGVAGHLVGWNLTLNSQGAVEDFQRGLHIPDPVERDTDNFWINADGRYAVARALQSDSARIWDLAFAKPIRAIPAGQNETLIGVDNSARHLVTATLETVVIWDNGHGRPFGDSASRCRKRDVATHGRWHAFACTTTQRHRHSTGDLVYRRGGVDRVAGHRWLAGNCRPRCVRQPGCGR